MLDTGRSILVVEDEPVTAMLIKDALEKAGYGICGTARTAGEAIEAAARLRPDLCIVDLNLADGSSGLEAAIELRARLGIPAILASAHADAELAALHGIRHWLKKPFTGETLVAAVSAALGS